MSINSSKGDSTTEVAPAETQAFGSTYRWYALAVLTLVYAIHMLDRTVVNVVLELLKEEFQLSDTQLGLLSGFAYGAVFSIVGIFMGLLVDRTNRRNLLAIILVIWSGLTTLSGFAGSYLALLSARMGIAAAESGGMPAIMSLISDYFPPKQRSTAIGYFYSSIGLGVFLSFMVGGYIAANWGWRPVFLMAGIPGIILAAVVLSTLREPRRGVNDALRDPGAANRPAPGLRATLRTVASSSMLVLLISSAILLALIVSATGGWTVSFLVRVRGFEIDRAATLYAIAGGGMAALGAVIAGNIADRMSNRDQRWRLWTVQLAALISMLAGLAMLHAGSDSLVILFMMVSNLFPLAFTGPLFAMILTLSPIETRGTVMALVAALSNLLGYGAGPLITGLMSDFYGGQQSLTHALTVIFALNAVVIILLYFASRSTRLRDPLLSA